MHFEKETSEGHLICLHFDFRQAVSDLAYDIWVGNDRCSYCLKDVARHHFWDLRRALKAADEGEINILLAFAEDHRHALSEAVLEGAIDAT